MCRYMYRYRCSTLLLLMFMSASETYECLLHFKPKDTHSTLQKKKSNDGDRPVHVQKEWVLRSREIAISIRFSWSPAVPTI